MLFAIELLGIISRRENLLAKAKFPILEVYTCKHCGFACDADLNASLNHSIDLPEIHFTLRSQRLNLGNGFYWLKQGLFTFDGQEFRVPDFLEKE